VDVLLADLGVFEELKEFLVAKVRVLGVGVAG
jgi:hypothetical protein